MACNVSTVCVDETPSGGGNALTCMGIGYRWVFDMVAKNMSGNMAFFKVIFDVISKSHNQEITLPKSWRVY
jgi:hypothetical protein